MNQQIIAPQCSNCQTPMVEAGIKEKYWKCLNCPYIYRPFKKKWERRLEYYKSYNKSHKKYQATGRLYLVGKERWSWKNGLSAVRNKEGSIRKQMSQICELCDKLTYDIHHKDGNLKNNKLENLMALCRKCHMKLDKRIFNLKQYATI